jgi:hypothetical protein
LFFKTSESENIENAMAISDEKIAYKGKCIIENNVPSKR